MSTLIGEYRDEVLSQAGAYLPAGFTIRAASEADVQEIVAMINASDANLIGAESFSVERLTSDWNVPNFNLETDSLVAITPQGDMAAYADVFDIMEPAVRVICWTCLHPDYTNTSIGSALLSWAEARARQALARAPQGARVILDSHVRHADERAARLYSVHGFQLVRHSLRMQRSLEGEIEAPVWPEGIRVRPFCVGEDARAITHAIRESFRDHFGFIELPFERDLEFLQHQIDDTPIFDPNFWFLAQAKDEIAAVCLCFTSSWDDGEMGWVGTLGVLRHWRRRGLGEALLKHAFREFQRIGKPRAGLMVDAQSLTGATRLYERVGMHSVLSHQYDRYEKELQSGEDLSVTSLEG